MRKFGAEHITMHRADLLNLLVSALNGGLYRTDAACVSAESQNDAAVVRFVDGSEVEADIVIGADDLDAALTLYERVRKPRATRAQLGSRFRAKQNHVVSPWARFRRDVRLAWNSRVGADSSAGQASAFYDYDVASPHVFDAKA